MAQTPSAAPTTSLRKCSARATRAAMVTSTAVHCSTTMVRNQERTNTAAMTTEVTATAPAIEAWPLG
nr:hypothetical protein [Kibdelosporangium sp. MJ126-NF4]